MRNIKDVIIGKNHNLYGRKFRVSNDINPKLYTIKKAYNMDEKYWCWIEWELDTGVNYEWDIVMAYIRNGTWILI